MPVSQLGFKRLVPGKGQQLTLLSLEVHALSRYGHSAALGAQRRWVKILSPGLAPPSWRMQGRNSAGCYGQHHAVPGTPSVLALGHKSLPMTPDLWRWPALHGVRVHDILCLDVSMPPDP